MGTCIYPMPVSLLKNLGGSAMEGLLLAVALHRDLHQGVEDRDISKLLDFGAWEVEMHELSVMNRKLACSSQKLELVLPVRLAGIDREKVRADELVELLLVVVEIAIPDQAPNVQELPTLGRTYRGGCLPDKNNNKT